MYESIILIGLLFSFVWGAVGAWLAGEKNRSKAGWFIICWLTGLIGIIILAIAGRKE